MLEKDRNCYWRVSRPTQILLNNILFFLTFLSYQDVLLTQLYLLMNFGKKHGLEPISTQLFPCFLFSHGEYGQAGDELIYRIMSQNRKALRCIRHHIDQGPKDYGRWFERVSLLTLKNNSRSVAISVETHHFGKSIFCLL